MVLVYPTNVRIETTSRQRKQMKRILLSSMIPLIAILCWGCTSDNTIPSRQAETVLYESSVSPNENYTENVGDKVDYTVRVCQDDGNNITVYAFSNSAFFNEIQYTVACEDRLDESNVDVSWTTVMGNPKGTEDDQFAVAVITVFSHGEVISERKINFANGAFEIVAEAMAK